VPCGIPSHPDARRSLSLERTVLARQMVLEYSAFRLGFSPAEEMDDHKCYYDVKDFWPLLVRAGFRPSDIRCFGTSSA